MPIQKQYKLKIDVGTLFSPRVVHVCICKPVTLGQKLQQQNKKVLISDSSDSSERIGTRKNIKKALQ